MLLVAQKASIALSAGFGHESQLRTEILTTRARAEQAEKSLAEVVEAASRLKESAGGRDIVSRALAYVDRDDLRSLAQTIERISKGEAG